jgi:uncharacterized protein
MDHSSIATAVPAWREPMVWLVVSGPLAVVVAGFVTLAIALHGADEVLPPAGSGSAGQPALTARNHAATPAPPLPPSPATPDKASPSWPIRR